MPTKFETKDLEEKSVNILDHQGDTLMQMPLSQCTKQGLLREIAIVFIKNKQNQYILTKQKDNEVENQWDIPVYADIYAHEIAEEAALRAIHQEFTLTPSNLQKITRIPINIGENFKVLASIFIMKQTELQEEKNIVYLQNKELLYLTIEEIQSLLLHSPELFSAEFIWAIQANWIN